jgi:hypothetical protein
MLSRQVPGRSELKPDMKTELDWTFTDVPEAYLAVDFDELLGEKRQWQERVGEMMGLEEVQARLERTPEAEAAEMYDRMWERLESETSFADEFDEMGPGPGGVVDWLKDGYRTGLIANQVSLFWDFRQSESWTGMGYDYSMRQVRVEYARPTFSRTIEDVATTGELPVQIGAVLHEYAHDLVAYPRDIAVNKVQMPDVELEEVFCIRFGERSVYLRPGMPYYKTNERIVMALKQREKIYGELDQDKLRVGIQHVDELRALGVPVPELASLIAASKWDEQTGEYSLLQNRIRTEVEDRLQIGSAELGNLVTADRLEREIDRLKVMVVAREILT